MDVDFSQCKRLLDALHGEGDLYYLLAYTEKGADDFYSDRLKAGFQWQRRGRFVQQQPVIVGLLDNDLLRFHLRQKNITSKFGVAASVASFSGNSRKEKDCARLTAFGVDVDATQLSRLVPGGISRPEDAVPRVVELMEVRGLRPHAVVNSGHGLHVYVLTDPISLMDAEDRTRAKNAWWKLCMLLGGATDRFDLASVLRLPGTINWKNGTPVPVNFIEENTDLTRPRYPLDAIERALSDLLDYDPQARPTPPRVRPVVPGLPQGAGDDFSTWLLSVALSLDGKLAEARASAHSAGTKDRSKADFEYVCRMLRVGLPEELVLSELRQTLKAKEVSDSERSYVQPTFFDAVRAVKGVDSSVNPAGWRVFQNSPEAIYKAIKGEARGPSTTPLVVAVDEADEPDTQVAVVLARPGDGKTTEAVEVLAQHRSLGGRAMGLSAFVGELLRHERVINQAFPTGQFPMLAYERGILLLGWPKNTHEDVYARLPQGIRQAWTLQRFMATVSDPLAFWLNCTHPVDTDERHQPEESIDGELRVPGGYASWSDPELTTPAAVVKFRGREDLCLAGHPAKRFTPDYTPCGECGLTACRANPNTNPNSRGAKTYWKEARYPLLSHQGYWYQRVFAPYSLKADALLVDELPGMVYRNSMVVVKTGKVKAGKMQWDADPLDEIENVVLKIRENISRTPDYRAADLVRLDGITAKLRDFRKKLKKLAQKLREEVRGEKRGQVERRVDTRSPILSGRDFRWLLVLAGRTSLTDDDGEVEVESSAAELSEKLLVLRDLSGDSDFMVYLEHDFDKSGDGALRLYRPVDGWPDLFGGGEVSSAVVLDATAGLDPRYMLRGAFVEEVYPEGWFPNTTIVSTGRRMGKTALGRKEAEEIVDKLCADVGPYLVEMGNAAKLLVLTDKENERRIEALVHDAAGQGKLPAQTRIAHFGNLRGRNEYRDFDAVYFTHPHQYRESFYVGLDLLLRGAGESPGQWANKNVKADDEKKGWDTRDYITARGVVSDIYQDALRIGIRTDTSRRAWIFVSTDEAHILVRLLRLFRGAELVQGDKRWKEPGALGVVEVAPDVPTQAVPKVNVRSYFGRAKVD